MPFLERDGVRLFFDLVDASDSTAKTNSYVTLVNGHTRSSSDFKLMARQLSSVGLTTILLDNRASGKSTTTRPFTLREMEDDVVAVWDHLSIKASHLLGISMGGFISQGIAARYPDSVSRLALISTGSGAEWIRPTSGGWINSGTMVEEKLASYFAPGFTERNKLLFETMVKQTKVAINQGQFTERSNLQRDALQAEPRSWDYSTIRAPTLIIHGSEDLVVDPKAAADLNQKIPGSKVIMIEGAGHLLLAESSKRLYDLVTEWFSEGLQQA